MEELLKRDQLLVFPVGRKTVVKEKNKTGISVMFNVTEVDPQEKKIQRDKPRVDIGRTLKERLEEHDEIEHYHKMYSDLVKLEISRRK